MANPTVNWATKVITVPQSFLTYISGLLYELDIDEFRLALKDIEDSEEGMTFLDTHRHNTQVTLSGVTYARTLEIINGYTVTFEDGQYAVRCVGANHNLADVKNVNQVSLIVGNAAGLILVSVGSGLSTEEHTKLMETADEDNVENHVATSLEIYDPPTRAEATVDKDAILASLADVKLETDKIQSVKDETDKISDVKLETDKIQSVKNETDKIASVKLETDKIQSVKNETNKIQDARDEIAVVQDDILDLLSQVAFIKKVEGGKWQILGNEMIFYDEDNIVEIMRFTITRDPSGNPIMRTRV